MTSEYHCLSCGFTGPHRQCIWVYRTGPGNSSYSCPECYGPSWRAELEEMSITMTNTIPGIDPSTSSGQAKAAQLGMILDLYAALQYREQCPNCGGKGSEYVDGGDGDVAVESCDCSNVAFETLERYAKHFEAAVHEYVKPENYEQVVVSENTTFAIEELLEKWTEQP